MLGWVWGRCTSGGRDRGGGWGEVVRRCSGMTMIGIYCLFAPGLLLPMPFDFRQGSYWLVSSFFFFFLFFFSVVVFLFGSGSPDGPASSTPCPSLSSFSATSLLTSSTTTLPSVDSLLPIFNLSPLITSNPQNMPMHPSLLLSISCVPLIVCKSTFSHGRSSYGLPYCDTPFCRLRFGMMFRTKYIGLFSGRVWNDLNEL
mmetsp:Transcript_37535/g.45842  ORF Transcript_37535/g.45842 Transcript_37535/m.45842 type:complete len:200 (+) Transcript_37535:491-1090(+)